jgi:prepilin-type N-terminal cleavage/methylation domain-containing protein
MTKTRRTRRARRVAAVTLVELMVALAIVGVMMAAAAVRVDSTPQVGDQARRLAGLLHETARRAVTGGPIRTDVAIANDLSARSRTRVFRDGTTGLWVVAVERAEEETEPSTDYAWVETARVTLPEGMEVSGYSAAAELEAGISPAEIEDELLIQCHPDGTCEAQTLYLSAGGEQKRYARIAIMPLTGAPIVFDGW